jgi:hypothetical protein
MQKTYITNTGVSQDKLKLVLIGNGLAGMRCLEDLHFGGCNIMSSMVFSPDKTGDNIIRL